jgi:glutathione-regulated potassium-efflux system protein KefB
LGAESQGLHLGEVVALLVAAVLAVPLFRRLGLGSVLGYLAAGLAIGPFGLRLITEPESILHVAELGVVLFLFIVGLEMRPSRLWGLRKQIFGLGVLQVAVCALLLTGVGVGTGFPVAPSFVSGAGFVLTSTAIVMQLLEERRQLGSPSGQRIVSILLLEDMMIVPLLALVAFLAPIAPGNEAAGGLDWLAIGIGFCAILGIIVVGRYLLNPLFRILAAAKAREVMTAAALLVVLGAALVMQVGGLSMAMGAFLAGVLLSESSFRHQLEADVEPFRGILLGLFFLAVGMSLDLSVVARNWQLVAFYVAAYMIVKAVAIYGVARLVRAPHAEALERAVLMAQGGEFAFVLYAAALQVGIISAEQNAILTAIVIVSMVLTPFAIALLKLVLRAAGPSAAHAETPNGLRGNVLVIGFGRVGQIASQFFFARGHEVSIIDNDVEMIESAREFGFKVYYGDGARLDILHAAGAERVRAIVVCVDDASAATRIVELIKAEFAHVPVFARAFDRWHEVALIRAGADFHLRETFESALRLGARTLERLGASADEIAVIEASVRKRDQQRLELEIVGGLYAGREFFTSRRSHEEKEGSAERQPDA